MDRNEVKAIFTEAYKSGGFTAATDAVKQATGDRYVKTEFGLPVFDTLLWCFAADIEKWQIAGIVGGAFMVVCPKCGEMDEVHNIYIHSQHHRNRY